MKLEDVLKTQGYTDADIAAVGPLLNDAKFRGALEGRVTALESELGGYKVENDKWADWAENTNKPKLDNLERERVETLAKAGSLEARLKALDPTFTGTITQPPERKPGEGGFEGFDPKKFGLITQDDVNTYAAGQGEAIVIANDLRAEYTRLTGTDMLDYSMRTQDGRELRGMTALLHEARAAKKPLPDYVADKFDFAGKRAAAADTARKAHEEAIRKDERTKVAAEYGNPNTRPGMPSAQPFIPVRTSGSEGKSAMPWDDKGIVNKGQLRTNRLANAMQRQAESTVQ